MYLSKILKITCTLALATLTMLPVSAQTTYRLPGQHNAEHKDLIAGQMNVKDQVKLESTQQLLDNFFSEEEEPELDIYETNWGSQAVNCYNEADVPQSRVINVANFAMPCPGYVTSPYGYRKRFRRMHKGIDLKVYTGDTIYAAFTGKVRLTRYQARGYGHYVVIRHENELETVYAHLSKVLVQPDQYVRAGQPIALGGNTGRSFGSHLHFETRFMGYPINPSAIFDFANQTVHTDEYTFDKRTYKNARDFSPAANAEHQRRWQEQQANNPNKVASTIPTSTKKKNGNSKSAGSASYTIRKGDTLSRIASRNGTTVKNICRLNGLSSNAKLRPGQKLRLR